MRDGYWRAAASAAPFFHGSPASSPPTPAACEPGYSSSPPHWSSSSVHSPPSAHSPPPPHKKGEPHPAPLFCTHRLRFKYAGDPSPATQANPPNSQTPVQAIKANPPN